MYTWDGKTYCDYVGRPVRVRHDGYVGHYVYEEVKVPTAYRSVPSCITNGTGEPSPSMQHLLIENNRLCAERDALLKELEVQRAQNLTLRSWLAENNDYAKGFMDGRAAERQDALDFLEQPVTDPHAPLHRAIRHPNHHGGSWKKEMP